MGRGLNLNLKLAMAAKSIKPVSINEAVLNDLASRFLLNIPREDQDDPMKLCTHIELAYWFYLDLVRPEDSTLPGCSMKEFMAAIFKHCPFLVKDSVMVDLDNYVAQWKAHKYKKPVRGGIILNHDWTKCLLVQGYPASTTWGFPKGKLEEGENDIDAAVRELYEETGFDSRGIIKEKWHLVAQVNGSEAKMYIIPGVPDNTHFEPKTRKEIRSIQWFRIDGLPRHRKDLTSKQALGKSANSFFMIIPFISQLKKWIASNSKGSARASKGKTISAHFQNPVQQQSHSKSSVPQTDSKPASPSAPPLDVISHRYGMGYGNETGEYRTGYGGMGMYNAPYSGTEIHNYQSTNHPSPHHAPPPQSPMTTNTSRDDTAPIPYPPQHPHTLHPNHTLPAPLHHTTTTGYHSHNAVYPSHLTYTNNSSHHPHHHHQQVHYHQLHHQQDHPSPHVPSNHHHHYPYYVQPVAMYPGGGSVNPIQQYGTGSMQQPQKSNSSPAHAAHGAAAVHVGPYHVQQNATPHPVVAKPPPTTGHVSTRPPPPPPSAFPIAAPGPGPGHAQQQSPRRMLAAATTSTNQHPHQYYQNYHTVAASSVPVHTAAVPVYVAAARQLFPPSTTTQSAAATVQYPPAAAGWQIHSSAHPQTQGQLYGRVGHQQASPQTRTQDRAAGLYDNMQYQQVSRSRDGEEVASADLSRLKLEQGGGMARYHSSPARPGDAGQDGYYGYSVVLKPAASMVGFKFNTEAILKASNQHQT